MSCDSTFLEHSIHPSSSQVCFSSAPIFQRLTAISETGMSVDLLTGYLPSELVIGIFNRVLEPESRQSWTEYSPPKITLTPFFLGKICRAWRHVVNATPDFWSTVTLTLHPHHYEMQSLLLRRWLVRSNVRPLTIIMRGQGGEADEFWEVCPPVEIFSQLVSVSNRWRNVDIFLPYPCYRILDSAHNQLPLLESLIIRPPDGVDPLFDYPLHAFRNAPRLQTFVSSMLYYSDLTMLPWTQFKELSAQDFTIDDCYSMLRDAHKLNTCRFDAIHQSSDFAYPSRNIIRLKHLTTLELSSIGNTVTTVFFYSIELPSLTDLKVSLGFSFDDRESFSLSSLTSLIGRSGCSHSLQRITLVNIRLIEQELIDCLASTPALTELHLYVEYPKSFPGMYISDIFLGALCPPAMRREEADAVLPFDRPLLPKLRVLDYSGPVHTTGTALISMLRFRWAQDPQVRLESVFIESASDVTLSSSVRAGLRDLIDEGMDLVLTNGYTSWIHDNWVPLRKVIRKPFRNVEGDFSEWAPHRYPQVDAINMVPHVLMTRRSETPGMPPPKRPLTNPPVKPDHTTSVR